MGAPRLDVRSAWGIRAGDKISVSAPVAGLCKAGEEAAGTVTGPGEFREYTAHFPVTIFGGGDAHVVVPYSGRGSEIELVRPSRIYRKM